MKICLATRPITIIRIPTETTWISNGILPIVNDLLPRPPKKRPALIKRSSCVTPLTPLSGMGDGVSFSGSTSHVEVFEHRDDLWTEIDEVEPGIIPEESETEPEDTVGTSKRFSSSNLQQEDENIQEQHIQDEHVQGEHIQDEHVQDQQVQDERLLDAVESP